MEYKIRKWFDGLKKEEKEVLIELLYSLNLEDYVVINDKGDYIGLR